MANIDILCAFASLFYTFFSLFHVLFFAFVALLLSDPAAVAPCPRPSPFFELVPLEHPANQLWHFICCAQVDPLSFVCAGKKVK